MTQGMLNEETKPKQRKASDGSSQDSDMEHSATPERLQILTSHFGRHLLPDRGVSSAPHSRSASVKSAKKPRPKGLELVQRQRSRTNSLPNAASPINHLSVSFEDFRKVAGGNQEDDEEPKLHRVRSFTKTSKGLVNRGDSFKRKSNNSVFGAAAACGPTEQVEFDRNRGYSSASNGSTDVASVASSTACATSFKVMVLGGYGVGKTALTQQFMTSEYLGACDDSMADDENIEQSVSVLVDGEESTVDFMDYPTEPVESVRASIDGYVVVFSITDRGTFDVAVDKLFNLRQDNFGSSKPVILVANKTDLVRKRRVTYEEGRSVAKQYGCKYIETSAAIFHNVDELLVGIVSQLRKKLSEDCIELPTLKGSSSKKRAKSSCMPKGAKGLLNRLLRRKTDKGKCDNLFD